MRGLILVSAVGLAFVASAQAAPLALNPASIEIGASPPVELVRDNCGRGWHRTRWRDQWGNWQWGDCVPNEGGYGSSYRYDAGARAGTSPIQICAVSSPGGVGVIHSNRPSPPPILPSGRPPVKTATDRAVEAIEAAELMFADEMGATLDLSPAAKMALIVEIAAAIEAAVAEERLRRV